MAVKEIVCPHCKKAVAPAGGFYHDDALNMLCGLCNGVIFPATKQVEDKHKFTLQGGHAQHHSTNWCRRDCLPIKVNSTSVVIPTKSEPDDGLSGYYCG